MHPSQTNDVLSDGLHLILEGLYGWKSRQTGSCHPVHSYIWIKDRCVVLIDPACDLTPAVLNTLGIAHVDHILITHLQEENVAGCIHFSNAAVHIPQGDAYLAEGTQAYANIVKPWPPPWDWSQRGNFKGHLGGARNERPSKQPLTLDEALIPGGHMADCQIIATSGHGKHAVTLIACIDHQRVGFCGDLVYDDGRMWNWFDCDWDYGKGDGFDALQQSLSRLKDETLDLLCPTHGPVMTDPAATLDKLQQRLARVHKPVIANPVRAKTAPSLESSPPGFRRLLPHLYQWARTPGNANILVSQDGAALMIDAGLCYWRPIAERQTYFHKNIEQFKKYTASPESKRSFPRTTTEIIRKISLSLSRWNPRRLWHWISLRR